jgi:hypothetical protein
MRRPKYSVGSSASIRPPVQAQSAGDQNTGSGVGAAAAAGDMGKPVLAADEAAEVADQRAVRDQRPLGRAGGAAGVDQHRGVVGAVATAAKRADSRASAVRSNPGRRAFGRADRDHRAQGRTRWRARPAARRRPLVDDRHLGFAVVQPVLQRLAAEEHRQRHRDRAQAVDRDVRDGRLEALRHHDGHAVAACHAEPRQRVRQPVGGLVQLAVAVVGAAAVLVLPGDGHRLGRAPRPARAADLGDVEARRHLPAQAGVDAVVAVGRGPSAAGPRRHRDACAPTQAGAAAKRASASPLTRQMRQSGSRLAPMRS